MKRRILVIAPAWVGDMVMAQSLFKVLHQQNPELHLAALAPAWTGPLMARMPEISEAITTPFQHKRLDLSQRFKFARSLKRQNFDQVIILPRSIKSALIPFFAGIKRRTGFLGEQRWGLINDIRPLDKQSLPLTVQRFVAMADKPDTTLTAIPKPRLIVDQESRSRTLSELDLALPKKPLLALCPGAEYGPAKQWPVRHFASLAREKINSGWEVWLFGAQKDADLCNAIIDQSDGKGVNLAGKTTLDQAIDLLSLADCGVSNDSGLMHILAAVNVPLVAIYGSSSASFTPPLSDKAEIVALGLDCQPCFKRHCPLEHLNCLNQLEPTLVDAAITRIKQ